MSGPEDDRTVEQPVVETPSVSTAPPPSHPRGWWSSIPSHLGKARTSTVVLAALFLAIGALYLNVRPDPVPPPPTTGGTVQTTAPAQTTAPPATTTPETTTPEPTSEPTLGTTEPAPEPTPSDLPTSTVEPTPPPEPTTVSPPG